MGNIRHLRARLLTRAAPLLLALLLLPFAGGGCAKQEATLPSPTPTRTPDGIRIGLSIGTMLEERWQRDRDIFIAKSRELGAEVLFQNANNDSAEQIEQVSFLLDQDIDVLVIVPDDADKAAAAVEMAHKKGIPVLSYDRLVRKASVDLYISFDSVKVGQLMAEAMLKAAPKGNYVILNGSESDNNSLLLNQGFKSVLKTALEKKPNPGCRGDLGRWLEQGNRLHLRGITP